MHCPARLRSGAGAGPTSTSTQRSCSIAACSGASTSGSASCSVSGSGLWRRTQWRRQQSSAHATPCHRAAAAPVAAASSAYLASAQAHALGGIRPFACGRSAFPTSGQQQQARRASIVAAAAGNGNGNGHRVEDVENVVIVGSGPAGYTAAIYAARANLKPVVFEGFQSGRGGQLMGTTEVENFPGFPEGVTGPELMDKMRKQAERWGAELYTEDVDHIDLDTRPFVIRTPERTVRAHSVIMATGASALRLNLPSEDQYWSKGISACAICDGASPLFKGRVVAVVGGGDSACEEAVYLTKYASHVHLIVRRSQLRASKAMQDRTLAHPRITVHFNTEVDDVYGAEVLHGLKLRDANTGEQTDLPAAGLFYGIGHKPNSDLIAGRVELDEKGYVKVHHGVSTNVEGVFAAGDLHDPEWRQAITAAGSGCQAALSVERYLTKRGLAREFQNLAAASMDNGSAHSAPAAAATPEVSPEEEFDINQDKHKGQFALRKLYHSSDRPLAVLYTAPSCGPCRSLKPILNGVMDEYKGRIHYVEIDIEVDPEIAEAAGVAGTPTFQLFKDKEQIVSVAGVKLKREYRSFINEALGVPVAV